MKLPAGLSESDVVKRVTVRLVMDQERAEFDRLLEEKHYVHESRLTGETLRYILELDGQWVALAAFSAASLHLKARERWIGWSPRQRARRLCMVVNNSRFLVLPERECYPNLASRGLGLCLRRLSQDWQERWGHPVWVVETFVDETRYRGTCYCACGFEAVGPTAGFARASRDYYDYHGEPKQLYLRELQPGARKPLRQARWPEALAEYEASRIETNHFASIIGSWLLEQEIAVLARLAVDGKVLRGSGRSDGKPLQLLSAVTHQLRLTLGQVPIEEIGLCGCWQVIAVERLSIDLTKLKDPPKFDGRLLHQQSGGGTIQQGRHWRYHPWALVGHRERNALSARCDTGRRREPNAPSSRSRGTDHTAQSGQRDLRAGDCSQSD